MRMFLTVCALIIFASTAWSDAGSKSPLWVTYQGGTLGKGKHIVLVSGDEEYRSEEALPQLAKILAKRHGFTCTVLFAIDPKDGTISPNVNNNIPGLELLGKADLMIIATRFRNLPDEQMKHVVDYLHSGRPLIGMRTATHAFSIPADKTYAKYSYNNKKEWPGGFGKQILGATWKSHHGKHKVQSTRGLIAKGEENHPIVRGIKDGAIWGPTDVYGVDLPLPGDSKALIMGAVLTGMKSSDEVVAGKQNDPMMPVAWVKTYAPVDADGGKAGRVFTTTMGAATDLESESVRRLLVNASYWALGMEGAIGPRSNVDLAGEYHPRPYGFGGYQKGVRPADLELKSNRGSP